jgi:hypothetical protein
MSLSADMRSRLSIGFVMIGDRRSAQILDQRLDARMPGNEHDALDRAAAELFQELEAVAVGQHEIEKQNFGAVVAENSARIVEALSRVDAVTVQGQQLTRGRHEIGLVIDEQKRSPFFSAPAKLCYAPILPKLARCRRETFDP